MHTNTNRFKCEWEAECWREKKNLKGGAQRQNEANLQSREKKHFWEKIARFVFGQTRRFAFDEILGDFFLTAIEWKSKEITN